MDRNIDTPRWLPVLTRILKTVLGFKIFRKVFQLVLNFGARFDQDMEVMATIFSFQEKKDWAGIVEYCVRWCEKSRAQASEKGVNPLNYVVMHDLARAAAREQSEENWKSALKEIELALASDSGYLVAELAQITSRAAYHRKDDAAALRCADEGIRADPSYTYHHVWAAWLKMVLKTDDAEGFVQDLIQRDPVARKRILSEKAFDHFRIVQAIRNAHPVPAKEA